MKVCQTYEQATALLSKGIHVISVDEKTGIQALERAPPIGSAQPGRVERREYEYERHGTCCLIASLDVVLGKLIVAHLGPSRTLCGLR